MIDQKHLTRLIIDWLWKRATLEQIKEIARVGGIKEK